MQSARGLLLPFCNQHFHSLRSKECGARRNKKSTKAKSSGANVFMHCIPPGGKAAIAKETEYPDFVLCGFPRTFLPQGLPRFYPSDRRIRAQRKEHSHFTVPFPRRGFSPRSSVSAFADRVPYANIHFAYNYALSPAICQDFHAKSPAFEEIFSLSVSASYNKSVLRCFGKVFL